MIPFIAPLNFTEVNSSGNLNQKAAEKASVADDLPIQYFKLTGNVAGNLTLDDNTAHKKIILDTNGYSLTNSAGSPLTTNSSIDVELKGSGNVQSTLKTFNTAVTSTSNTGTVTFSNSDSSTVVVATADRTADISASGGVSVASGFGGSMSGVGPFYFPITELLTLPSNPGGNTGSLSGGASTAVAQLFTLVGGAGMPNLQSGAGFSVNVDGTVHTAPSSTSGSAGAGFQVKFGDLTFENFGSGGVDVNRIRIFGGTLSVSAMKIPNNVVNNGSRLFTYTNNLATSVILSGDNPFDDITVSAGATATFTRTSTDGSFNITGTVSGNDSDSQPFVLTPVNNGTGDISTTAYTGTLSASAL